MKFFYKEPRDTTKLPLDRNENLNKSLNSYITEIVSKLKINFNCYPDNLLELCDNISKLHEITPQEVVMSNGSEEALSLLFNYLLPSYKKVVKWEPTFGLVNVLLQRHECDIINYGFDLLNNKLVHKYKFALLDPLQKHIFYISSPNSPTGSVFCKTTMTLLVQQFANSLFILDGAYVDYDEDYYIKLYKRYSNIILVRTFSKSWGLAGLRAGYFLTNDVNLQNIRPNYAPNIVASMVLNEIFKHSTNFISYCIEETNSIKTEIKQFLKQRHIHYIETVGNFILFQTSKINLENLALKCLFKTIFINNTKYIKISIPDRTDVNWLFNILDKCLLR